MIFYFLNNPHRLFKIFLIDLLKEQREQHDLIAKSKHFELFPNYGPDNAF